MEKKPDDEFIRFCTFLYTGAADVPRDQKPEFERRLFIPLRCFKYLRNVLWDLRDLTSFTLSPKSDWSEEIVRAMLRGVLEQYCSRYMLIAETEKGRLHYHGFVRFKDDDMANRFAKARDELSGKIGFMCLKPTTDRVGWLNYCLGQTKFDHRDISHQLVLIDGMRDFRWTRSDYEKLLFEYIDQYIFDFSEVGAPRPPDFAPEAQ